MLSLCANVHWQGSHPHWSMWQHVSVCQEKVPPSAQWVWLHLARGESHHHTNILHALTNVTSGSGWLMWIKEYNPLKCLLRRFLKNHSHKKQPNCYFLSYLLSRCSTAASSRLKTTTTTCVWRVRWTRTRPTSPSVILPNRRSVRRWDLPPTSTPGTNRLRPALCSVATTAGSTDGGPKCSRMRGWRCGPCCASCRPPWPSSPFCWIHSASRTLRGPSSSCPCAVTCTVLPTW